MPNGRYVVETSATDDVVGLVQKTSLPFPVADLWRSNSREAYELRPRFLP